jgi:hypothetical protein
MPLWCSLLLEARATIGEPKAMAHRVEEESSSRRQSEEEDESRKMERVALFSYTCFLC